MIKKNTIFLYQSSPGFLHFYYIIPINLLHLPLLRREGFFASQKYAIKFISQKEYTPPGKCFSLQDMGPVKSHDLVFSHVLLDFRLLNQHWTVTSGKWRKGHKMRILASGNFHGKTPNTIKYFCETSISLENFVTSLPMLVYLKHFFWALASSMIS